MTCRMLDTIDFRVKDSALSSAPKPTAIPALSLTVSLCGSFLCHPAGFLAALSAFPNTISACAFPQAILGSLKPGRYSDPFSMSDALVSPRGRFGICLQLIEGV